MSLRAIVLSAALLACGCAQLAGPRPAGETDEIARCEGLYADVDRTVTRAGAADGGAARIEGFPQLRVDRLLASFAEEVDSEDRFAAWVERMSALDRGARRFELDNLPAQERARLERFVSGGIQPALERCAELLTSRDLASAARRATLREKARVPDDYDTWKRVIGLYWITRMPFANGVRSYQEETQAVFDGPVSELPARGRPIIYAPPEASEGTAAEVREILARSTRNALGILEPQGEDAERLFAVFAPVWIVDERDANDRIGPLTVSEDGHVEVQATAPVVYRRFAHTRYHERVLLQLVYSVWFPARPKVSATDLLGGHLDAVIWRVTLGPDGVPLIFDSIHSCGCYHQFFPTSRAHPLPQQDTLDEQAFVPQRLGALEPGEQTVIRLEAGTHYIQRVLVEKAQSGVRYAFAADDALRSIRDPSGRRRSAFRPDGIIPGSERGERDLFWPMGVREPGAMRQWGRHATAFVGRRHFDEARLIERYFVLQLN